LGEDISLKSGEDQIEIAGGELVPLFGKALSCDRLKRIFD
jgi:hypothetical protein